MLSASLNKTFLSISLLLGLGPSAKWKKVTYKYVKLTKMVLMNFCLFDQRIKNLSFGVFQFLVCLFRFC